MNDGKLKDTYKMPSRIVGDKGLMYENKKKGPVKV